VICDGSQGIEIHVDKLVSENVYTQESETCEATFDEDTDRSLYEESEIWDV